MTLVIVQRTADKLTFSSDSRLSFDDQGYFDKGIKIFKVPLRIRGPLKSIEDRDKYEFEFDYGLAIIGSSINAYTVKESITELLSNIQYLTNTSDISIMGLGHLILKVYGEVSKALGETLRERGLSEILVGGYCIKQKRVRLLRFYPKVGKENIEYLFEEILDNEGIEFFGSGKVTAREIFEANTELKPLQIVKRAIESGKDLSIGGNLQTGAFFTENFKISGVVEKIDTGKEIVTKHYLRGSELDQEKSMMEYPNLFVAYSYTPVD